MPRIITTRITAKTPDDVKHWVNTKPHHLGWWARADGSDSREPRDATHFMLRGKIGDGMNVKEHTLRIPLDVHAKTFLKPNWGESDRGTHMFLWDDEAEAAAKAKSEAVG